MQTDFWQCNFAVPDLCCVAGAFCCLPSPPLAYPSSNPSIIAQNTVLFLACTRKCAFFVPPVLVVLLQTCALLVLLHHLYLCAFLTWAWLTHISPLLTSNWPHNHHHHPLLPCYWHLPRQPRKNKTLIYCPFDNTRVVQSIHNQVGDVEKYL